MLRTLSGQTHQVITGVCLVCGAQSEVFTDATAVSFKNLSVAVIEEYLRTVQVLDKAGAYGIQERGELLVERIEGSYSNVMGLPLEKLRLRLAAWQVIP